MIERPCDTVARVAERPRQSGRPAEPGAPLGGDTLPAEPDAAAPALEPWATLFGEVSPAEGDALAAIARQRPVAAGAMIFGHGEPAGALVAVSDGEAALGAVDAAGQFRLERPVRAPGWLDQTAAWVDGSHACHARASSAACIVELPVEALRDLLERHPALALRLIRSLARESQRLKVGDQGLRHQDAPARFASWLLERCGSEAGPTTVQLGERKRDIASQLAITPETLSRLMRSLGRQGLIAVDGYTVSVVDVDGLRRLAAR